MSSTLLLIDFLGAAALLLYGLGLLKSGIRSAFGVGLRQFLASSTRNRMAALGAGFTATLALQSSTATAVMISSFVAQGLVAPAMAQAIMLGANVGTAVVTLFLSMDIHWLAPFGIVVGVTLRARKTHRRQALADVAIGMGLMFLSLKLMSEATEPMRASAALAAFFGLLDDVPIIAIVFSAALAAASASSLAVILFVMSLAAAGSIGPELCLLLVAGANLGGTLPPLLAVASDGAAARRVAISNLLVRGVGAAVMLLIATSLVEWVPVTKDLAQFTIQAHIALNVGLALVFLPLIALITVLVAKVVPDDRREKAFGPLHLDATLLIDPPSALAAAMRETLRVGDLIELMLETSLTALKTNDELLCRSVNQLDDQVDSLQEAIKLYLARITPGSMDEAARQKSGNILDYAINLEHVGDIIERSLSQLTIEKIEKQLRYSAEGMGEIEELFQDTIENLQLAQRVFINRDAQIARRLMEGKVTIRRKEKASVERHMVRLQDRRPETLQTTSLHMDVLRDLKRINGHLMSVATPILEEAGLLRESRLKKG
jgi:phosphate:Na+ symporter